MRIISTAALIAVLVVVVYLNVWGLGTVSSSTMQLHNDCPPVKLINLAEVRAVGAGSGVQRIFEKVYKRKAWGDLGGGSGRGSTLRATATTRILLEFVVLKYGISSITDAPCGSMHWIHEALVRIAQSVPCLQYTGVDVARPIVATAAESYGDVLPGRMSFLVWDLTLAPLPAAATHELVVCRDALQHLSLDVSP